MAREIPLIFEAGVGKARDTVVLKLAGAVPPRAALWYGYGLDPYCNLTDGMDMAVPVFGPIPLDDVVGTETAAAATAPASARPQPAAPAARPASAEPVKALIITGDNVGAHDWKETSKALEDLLEEGGRIKVDVTAGAVQGPDRREPGQVRRVHPQLQGHARAALRSRGGRTPTRKPS